MAWSQNFRKSEIRFIWYLRGGLEMAPHVNEWSPLDGAHKQQVTVIVGTMIVQPSISWVISSGELYCCRLLSC